MEKLGSTASPSLMPREPRLSVIMPVRDGEAFLAVSLPALRGSDLPREAWELIVVDDASLDASARLAGHDADVVLRLPAPHGAGYARNRGAERARGAILVMIDADVRVHPDTLRRFAELFEREPDVAAAFGAYDSDPPAQGLVTQYRNLLHRYVHLGNAGDAETFWSGCGACRREVFAEVDGFDETRRHLEDIELGYRVRRLGHRIVLRPDIQCTHLKRWTVRTMVYTDLVVRGITWMRLHLEHRRDGRRATLNLRPGEQVCTLLTGLAGGALIAAALTGSGAWALASAGLLALVLLWNAPLLRWFARERGPWFALGVLPLRILYYALNVVAAAAGWAGHAFAPRRPGRQARSLAVAPPGTPPDATHSRTAPPNVAT